jgi:hypothetical protein
MHSWPEREEDRVPTVAYDDREAPQPGTPIPLQEAARGAILLAFIIAAIVFFFLVFSPLVFWLLGKLH